MDKMKLRGGLGGKRLRNSRACRLYLVNSILAFTRVASWRIKGDSKTKSEQEEEEIKRCEIKWVCAQLWKVHEARRRGVWRCVVVGRVNNGEENGKRKWVKERDERLNESWRFVQKRQVCRKLRFKLVEARKAKYIHARHFVLQGT